MCICARTKNTWVCLCVRCLRPLQPIKPSECMYECVCEKERGAQTSSFWPTYWRINASRWPPGRRFHCSVLGLGCDGRKSFGQSPTMTLLLDHLLVLSSLPRSIWHLVVPSCPHYSPETESECVCDGRSEHSCGCGEALRFLEWHARCISLPS